MNTLEPFLPKDIKIKFQSPFQFENIVDPNTFRLSLSGKYCDVQTARPLIVNCRDQKHDSFWPSPSFEGVRIGEYWMDE